MSFKTGAEYAAKDKIETILADVFKDMDNKKAAKPILDIKTVLLGSVFVAFISCLASCATCLLLLRM